MERLRLRTWGFQPVRTDPCKAINSRGRGYSDNPDASGYGAPLGLAILVIFHSWSDTTNRFGYPCWRSTLVPRIRRPLPGHWLPIPFSAASMASLHWLASWCAMPRLIIDFARDYQLPYALEEAAREAGVGTAATHCVTTLAIALGTRIMVPDPVFGGLAITLDL